MSASQTETVQRTCPNCKKKYELTLESSKLRRWELGEHVQDVWPEKSATDREQIVTGMCSDKCWNEYLGGEE